MIVRSLNTACSINLKNTQSRYSIGRIDIDVTNAGYKELSMVIYSMNTNFWIKSSNSDTSVHKYQLCFHLYAKIKSFLTKDIISIRRNKERWLPEHSTNSRCKN